MTLDQAMAAVVKVNMSRDVAEMSLASAMEANQQARNASMRMNQLIQVCLFVDFLV